MGGAKKKSMAQMEKQQVQQEKRAEETKKGKGKSDTERRAASVNLMKIDESKIKSELSKMAALTPYSIASQFNVRLSVARDLLEDLERKRLVSRVGGNSRISIYRTVAG